MIVPRNNMLSCSTFRILTLLIGCGSSIAAASSAPVGTLGDISCDKASITGAYNATCTVSLSGATATVSTPITLRSSNPAVSVPAVVNIPAGHASTTFTAKIAAVDVGQTGTVSALSGSILKTYSIQLGAITPQLSLSAAALDFGSPMVGSTAVTRTLKLNSTGTAPLTVSSLTVSGAGLSVSGPKLPLTLGPGQSTTVTVKLTPTAAGPINGTVTVSSNAALSPNAAASLSGTVTAFKAALSGFFCNNSAIIGTGTDSCVVVLTGAASADGVTVNVSSNNDAVLVPTTFKVASGESKAAFTVSRTAAGTSPSASITVSEGSTSRVATLSLVASSPVLSLPAGNYANAIQVTMSDATPGVDIFYTTDGSAPTSSSTKYSGPLMVGSSEIVKAIAFGSSSASSAPTVASYVVTSQVAAIPPGSTFVVPAADACQSPYDQFYGSEPGVYALWPMCEAGANIDIYDYVGNWGLSKNHSSGQVLAWGSGNIAGGLPGPVPDNETAAQVATTASYRSSVGIPLNAMQGTIATWIQAQSTLTPEQAMTIYTSTGKSYIALGTRTSGTTCFRGIYVDSMGVQEVAEQCGYSSGVWYRVVMTWNSGTVNLYVNGSMAASKPYAGRLDTSAFNYRLFPACCGLSTPMTLAKALVANQAWSAGQVATDFSPILTAPPAGGLLITNNQLGTIHKDVLGFADDGSDLSNAAQTAAVKRGLTAAGVTAVRYAKFSPGISADLVDWQGTAACSNTRGATQLERNPHGDGGITTYVSEMAQPLGLDVGLIVNYGSNPPYCDGGGDPLRNGSALANYTNVSNHLGTKYWEIGNEIFTTDFEPDFHSESHSGASYVASEPVFYEAIKLQDPNIQIGVPIAGSNYGLQTNFDLPVMASGKYDAIVFHNYPIKTPVTDGATLYRDRAATDLMKTRGALLTLQTELLNNNKAPDSIWVTEWDANLAGDQWTKQSMGAVVPLFAAGELGEYMRAGVKYATWWAQSAINVCSNSNYDSSGDSTYSWSQCGSAGLVYNGPMPSYGHEVLVGLAPGDLMPAAHAFQVLSQSGFVVEGEHMLSTTVDGPGTPWLQSYAATHGDSYAVMLINRDRDNAHTLPLEFAGMRSGGSVKQWTYGRAQYDLTKVGNWSAGPTTASFGPWSGTFEATLPPWSVSAFVFNR